VGGKWVRVEEAWAWALSGEIVPGIAQGTGLEREATTTDAAVELIAKAGESLDAVVEVGTPTAGEFVPVFGGRGALIGEGCEGFADLGEGYAGALGDFDDGNAAEYFAGIAALVAGVAPTLDEALCLVEVEG